MRCLLPALLALAAAAQQPPPEITRLSTPGGVRFGIAGRKGPAPSPTLLIFSGAIEEALGDANFNRMGRAVQRSDGFLLVSLDLPCHGADRDAGEPAGLAGWAYRLRRGQNFLPQFVRNVSSVLDWLIAERYTDPRRIAVSGTSRGGFMAFQFAAADPRPRWVIAFAPVTALNALSEFSGLWGDRLTRSLALVETAGKLTGRSLWFCIGNLDDRVDTEAAIAFERRVVEASLASGGFPDVTLELQPTIDHAILPDSHDKAAAWLSGRLKAPYVPPR